MTAAPSPARRWPNAVPVLLLAVGLAYANAVNTGFVFDDGVWVTAHPALGDARAYLAQSGTRWLPALTVLVNNRLGGFNPLGYHLFNVGVHALAVLTLFALLRRVLALPRFGGRFEGRGEFLAFAVALLWAVHPLNTQAVTYVIQRMESMMGLFFLLTLYCWTRGATDGRPRLWYPLAILSYFACCSCKEVCVALPPVLWAFDRLFLADRWRTIVRARWLPHLAILAVWGYTLRPALGGAFGASEVGIGFGLDITPFQYLLTETEVILHYLWLVIWPVKQVGDMGDWPVAHSVGEVWPALAAVVALFVVGVGLLVARPAVGFLFLWFFVILGPTSSVMPIADAAFEHRMYLPLIAVLVGLVFAVDALLGTIRFRYSVGRPLVAVVLLAVVAVTLGRLTMSRNTVYRNGAAFMEDVYAARPNNWRQKAGVADIRMSQGRFDDAQELLDELVAEKVSNVTLRVALGQIAYLEGRFGRAADFYREMAKDPWPLMPRYVYRVLVPCELAAQRYAAAAESARVAADTFPDSSTYRFLLATAELAADHPAAARAALDAALARDPAVANGPAAAARQTLFARHSVPAAQKGLWEVAYWRVAAANLADGDRNPEWLDTQAQLAARLGRFPAAVAAGEKGLAASADHSDWRTAHAERLKLYRAGKVFGPQD